MPTAEFACQDFGYEFELIKKMSDQSLPEGIRFQSVKVEKLLSVSSFQSKRTGWAHDEYINSSDVKPVGQSGVDKGLE